MSRAHRRSAFTAFLVTVGLVAGVPAGAQAGVLVDSATDCDSRSASQVFLPWLDVANYVLAPGGRAESAAGWSFDGAAGLAGDQEPWNVAGENDTKSIKLPAGSSATTASMCVGIEHPTLRFFARSSGTGLLSSLRADVLFEDSFGTVHALPIGIVTPGSAWNPTLPMVVTASLLPLLPNEQTAVAFRFTPQGPGSWWIDDVHVDPWRTR